MQPASGLCYGLLELLFKSHTGLLNLFRGYRRSALRLGSALAGLIGCHTAVH